MWDVSCSPDVLLEDRFRADTSWLFSNTWECALDPVGGATIGEEYGLQVLRQSVAFKNVALTREPSGNNFVFINKQELCWSFAYKMAQGFTAEAAALAAQQSGVYRSVNQDALPTRFPSSPLGYQLFGVPWTERTSLSRAEYPASSGLLSGARGFCPFPFNEDLSTDINDLAVTPQPLSAVLENEDLRFVPCRRPSPEQVFAVEFPLLPESAFGAAVLGTPNATFWKVHCFPLRESLRHNSAMLLRCLRLENYPHVDCVVHVPIQFIQINSEAEVTWSEADEGLSCETHCRQRSRTCPTSAFAAANLANIYQLGLYVPSQENTPCSSIAEVATQTNISSGEYAGLALPFRGTGGGQCFVPAASSAASWKYSCAGGKNNAARLCPCTSLARKNILLPNSTLRSLITNQCASLQPFFN
jgi:hypothetical protein